MRATLGMTLVFLGGMLVLNATAQATPSFGEVRAPTFGEVPAPSFGNAKPAPAPTSASAPAAPAVTPASAPPAPAPAAGLAYGEQQVLKAGLHYSPTGWSGRYFAMVNGSLDKWDFYADGTFLHQGVWNGGGAFGESSQRGVYSIRATTITLQFAPAVTAADAMGGGSTALTAGQSAAPKPHTLHFEMEGNQGSQGVVLGQEHLQPRDWE